MDESDQASMLPTHISNAIETIAQLHDNHERAVPPIQRGVESVTGKFARPTTLVWITILCAIWIAASVAAPYFAIAAYDPPPFFWLQGILGLLAVFLTCMILTTQRRADILASQRAQLTLELAILTEQKCTKTITLLEELRRDHPQIRDRIDLDAEAMSASTDSNVVREAIVELLDETEQLDGIRDRDDGSPN